MSALVTESEKGDILLVDDQLENLTLLTHLLEEVGHTVRQAINGSVALQAIAFSPPDLVLLDINMPDMDGYAVCQHLRENTLTHDIPVIFISALDESWDKMKAFSVGGNDYITKPFKTIEVLARVQNHLKVRRLQQTLRVKEKELLAARQEIANLKSA
ncbi:MAG: response regulator [Leptolyngbya sp. SIO3F4]|nr:response regulator [Leptolyngbya sp. SIO3F4]